ncbi:M28 family peptidase [Aquipuribacter sp. MA13-6]|uniref:M28 family peptidase n=1 Tax=unclassified Aquipuribacter TaxID=2635084 RepID=UPI003EEC049D
MIRPTSLAAAHQVSRRAALAAIGGTAATAGTLLAAPAWAVDAARPGSTRSPRLTARDRVVVGRVQAELAVDHILELSEGIGPRIGGTPSERAAAEYMAAVLDGYGYDVELETFPVADKFLAEVDGDPVLDQSICWQMGAAPLGALDVSVTGPAVLAGDGSQGELTGAVALVETVAGTTTAARTQRVQLAVSRGAVAVIVLPADNPNPIRRTQASSPALSTPVAVPVLGSAQVQKARLQAAAAAGPLTLTVATTAYRGLTSQNVLASRAGRGAPAGQNEAVMVCGHYDSVIGAPGANDDGSGTALTLELARVMRSLPTQRDIRFSLWGSEEQGLIGSRYHVAQLDQSERDRLVGVYNNDMVATSWDPATRYWVLSWDGSANIINTSVIAAAERLGYSPHLSPITTRGASDHQSFQERGIASSNFSWRGEESPALLEPPYHSPEDTVALNISMERMQVSLELIGAAMYTVAREG